MTGALSWPALAYVGRARPPPGYAARAGVARRQAAGQGLALQPRKMPVTLTHIQTRKEKLS
jgi:hypothetical protein